MPRVWTEEQKCELSKTQKERVRRERERMVVPAPAQTGARIECGVRVSLDEITQLSGEQIDAFVNGIAKVVVASNR